MTKSNNTTGKLAYKALKSTLCLFLAAACVSGCTTAETSTGTAASGTKTVGSDSADDGLWKFSPFDQNTVFQDDILNSDTLSISFWIKPDSNKTDTVLFSLENDDGKYLKLISSGYSDTDGTYSGLTLMNNRNESIAADGADTLKTNRYNYVAVNINSSDISIYLNGSLAAEGKIKNKPNSASLYLGCDSSNENSESGYYSGWTVSTDLLSEEAIQKEYNKKYAAVLLDTITFGESADQINNLWLVDTTIDGVPVTYTVSNKDVMDYRGIITRPKENTVVELTASISTDTSKATKKFEIHVLADSDETFLKRDAESLNADINGVMYSGQTLPTSESYGSSVTYRVISGNATVQDGILSKTGDAEKEKIILEATLNQNELKQVQTYEIVLLDEIAGYVMSYFNGDVQEGEEKGKLAYSTDGLNWTSLNNCEPIITSELGNGRIRDPYISRDADGNFVILATEGFDNPYIYVMHSKDLIDLSDQSLVRVAYYDSGLEMSGERAWAPEMTYDNENGLYYIYFSDSGYDSGTSEDTGHIYYVTTKDFKEYSYPKTLFSPGYTVIDGTILTNDGHYWLFYKDERKGSQTIFYASGRYLNDGFQKAYDGNFLLTQKYVEGPFILTAKDNETHYLYVDCYSKATFRVASFTTLGDNADLTWLDESEYSLPEEDVRHGSSVPVTAKELDALIQAYQ